jgi:alpha/beta superfamily hydrolase
MRAMTTLRGLTVLLFAASLVGCAWPVSSQTSLRGFDYRVGPYVEHATLHTDARAPATRQPAVLMLHGGFDGDDRTSHDLAQRLAEAGVVVLVPSYRGERRHLDGARSQGRVEFCRGEVDDARALLVEARQRADVDPERVGLLGFSHGGCIALQLALTDARVKAVVTFSAPTEADSTYQNLLGHPWRLFGYYGWLASFLAHAAGVDRHGVPPLEKAARWHERSPVITLAERHELIGARLLLLHGLADDVVPANELERFAQLLSRDNRVEASRFDAHGRLISTQSSPPKPGVPEVIRIHYYEGQGHTFQPAMKAAVEQQAVRFLVDELRR